MPFRIIVIVFGEVAAAIGAVAYPYLGLLLLLFMTFARPQSDRPNVIALHIPLIINSAIATGSLIRLRSTGQAFLIGVKRLFVILVFFVIMLASALNHYTPFSGARLDDFTAIVALCLLMLGWVTSEIRLQGTMLALFGASAYLIQVAILNPRYMVEEIGGQTYTRLNMGMTNEFGQTNYLALYMVITFLLCLSMMTFYRAAWQRLGLLGLSAAAIYVFFRANSRGATLALAAGLIVLWSIQREKLKRLVVGVVLIGLAAIAAPSQYWERMATVGHYEEDASATSRLEFWDIALRLIDEHPFLGVGPDNFTLYARNTPHNAYLQVGSELGLPALIVYVSVLAVGLRSAGRACRLSRPDRQGRPFLYAFSQGILVSLLAIVVQGFTTGLAHREFVYVFVTLSFCVVGLAEKAQAPEGDPVLPAELSTAEHIVSSKLT